jgi:hypothetical protein
MEDLMIEEGFNFPLSAVHVSVRGDGYARFYMPTHPLASSSGMVLAARHAGSLLVGHWLTPNAIAIHKDGNRSNCDSGNLWIGTRQDLARRMPSHQVQRIEMICARTECGKEFDDVPSHAVRRRYCCPACAQAMSRRFEVSPEEMAQMVWEMPTTKVAESYGVSDKAIEKFCKKHGINKPQRGYWAKQYAGQRDFS